MAGAYRWQRACQVLVDGRDGAGQHRAVNVIVDVDALEKTKRGLPWLAAHLQQKMLNAGCAVDTLEWRFVPGTQDDRGFVPSVPV